MTCPRCGSAMAEETLDGHLGRPIVIDLCFACQVFWFDQRESLRLSPASTLRLFRVIGEQTDGGPPGEMGTTRCPRCTSPLRRTQDLQRSTRFEYWTCPNGHGRLTTFFNFLREKDYVRPLTGAQLEALRRNVQMLHCSNCGASIDLARASACGHCGSPVTMLDLGQAERLIARLQQADRSGVRPGGADGHVDPALAMRLSKARREVDAAFDALAHDTGWRSDVSRSGLVSAGLHALARWLK